MGSILSCVRFEYYNTKFCLSCELFPCVDYSVHSVQYENTFSHTHPEGLGEAGFFIDHSDAMNKNADDEDADMFSILDQLEQYRTCTCTLHFKLCYPELSNNFSFPCNKWIQLK